MKEEMVLVQEMEESDDRNAEQYANQLQAILSVKSESVMALRNELQSFVVFRSKEC